MQLVNTTALPAVGSAHVDRLERRLFVVTAKATFGIAGGAAELDRGRPEPLRVVDEPTELGTLPADCPRFDDAFEVLVLGRARPAGGGLVSRQIVTLSVGDVTRQLVVTGDRRWVGRGATTPVPFEAMALVWERAFGGHCDLYLDLEAESPLEIAHTTNRAGRGFDPQPYADCLARDLRLPPGLPWYRHERWLPNVEHPGQLVVGPDDVPQPAGWSPIPRELAAAGGETVSPLRATALRAHDDWLIARPPAGAAITMTGLGPAGRARFQLPRLRVLVDHDGGTAELLPQQLLLHTEDERMTLLYRTAFLIPDGGRRARLRTEDGWCPAGLELDP